MTVQSSWHQHSEVCSGNYQSPIHIDPQKAVPLAIPALEMIGFRNLLPRPVSVTNNGHSVELKPSGRKHGKIFGALLSGIYNVEAIHFHWGRSNNRGSEHVISNVRYPLEMHIVTRNHRYETISEALKYKDGITVMAFFFHLRERGNSALQPLIDELEMVQTDGSTVYLSKSLTLSALLPHDIDIFYTYRGSLTTPPCSEAVTWIVFPDPMPISYTQMKKFRQLSMGPEAMVDNYRHLQPVGKRKIFVRRQASEFLIHRNVFRNHTVAEFWED
ncbi:hypothetical protein AAG570_010385 [Ranatra chinensis]|uniref:Carbonic anhydrase n=1 Tax=Ranatra chinensis TaxID=642074 RepID=A0ABD0YMN7_9HEMI